MLGTLLTAEGQFNWRICSYLTSLNNNFITVWLSLLLCCNMINIKPRWCFESHKALYRYNISQSFLIYVYQVRISVPGALSLLVWRIPVTFPPLNGWVRYYSCSQCFWVYSHICHHLQCLSGTKYNNFFCMCSSPTFLSDLKLLLPNTRTSVVFPIINFDHKKLSHYKFYHKKVHTNQWVFKNDKNKIPQTETFIHLNCLISCYNWIEVYG